MLYPVDEVASSLTIGHISLDEYGFEVRLIVLRHRECEEEKKNH